MTNRNYALGVNSRISYSVICGGRSSHIAGAVGETPNRQKAICPYCGRTNDSEANVCGEGESWGCKGSLANAN